jgi:cobalamin biosynthesis Mg chelatase CobN
MHGITNCKDLLYIYSREWFSKYQDVRWIIIAVLFYSTLLLQNSNADEIPQHDAQPLSKIVRTLEEQGFIPIVEIEFEDDIWEVEAYKEGDKRELKVDPVSGRIISDQKDD